MFSEKTVLIVFSSGLNLSFKIMFKEYLVENSVDGAFLSCVVDEKLDEVPLFQKTFPALKIS